MEGGKEARSPAGRRSLDLHLPHIDASSRSPALSPAGRGISRGASSVFFPVNWTLRGRVTAPAGEVPLCIVSRYTKNMKKLTLSDYQALAEFRYQIRRFLHFSERAVQAAGLERGQYQVMLAIKGMPRGVRPRIRELANRMQIQHHSAVELINRLESGGYVRRERAEDDRREVLLALTPKGEHVLAELALHHREELRSAAPSLVAALRRVMEGGTAKERVRRHRTIHEGRQRTAQI